MILEFGVQWVCGMGSFQLRVGYGEFFCWFIYFFFVDIVQYKVEFFRRLEGVAQVYEERVSYIFQKYVAFCYDVVLLRSYRSRFTLQFIVVRYFGLVYMVFLVGVVLFRIFLRFCLNIYYGFLLFLKLGLGFLFSIQGFLWLVLFLVSLCGYSFSFGLEIFVIIVLR